MRIRKSSTLLNCLRYQKKNYYGILDNNLALKAYVRDLEAAFICVQKNLLMPTVPKRTI